MTKTDLRNFRRLISILRKAEDQANLLDATLDNGAEIGSVIGSIADELEVKCDAMGLADIF